MSDYVELNINEMVLVKLTEEGRRLHRAWFYSFWRDNPNQPMYSPPKEDEAGYSSWQLWNLMETFGPDMGIGSALVFETVIRIPSRALKAPATNH
jgi:hypothetical protein